MILKILGAVLILASTSLTGLYFGNQENYCIDDLTEFRKALAILKSEIEFSLNPLPQAFVNISTRVKKPISKIFISVSANMRTHIGENLSQLWESGILEHAKETSLSKRDIEQLISFGKTLGYLDRGMQLANIELAIDYINERIDELNISRNKNKRMYSSLGVLGGLLVIVIFI